MTKAEAIMCFKQIWEWQPDSVRSDLIAKRESWNNFTDSLCKDGNISLEQYENWGQPF